MGLGGDAFGTFLPLPPPLPLPLPLLLLPLPLDALMRRQVLPFSLDVDVPADAVDLCVDVPALFCCRSSDGLGLFAALCLLLLPLRNILSRMRPKTAGTERNRWRRGAESSGDLDLKRM